MNKAVLNIIELLVRKQKEVCWGLILFLLAVLSFYIVKDATFVFGDAFQILEKIVFNDPTFAWCTHGRFWFLGLTDYNYLLLFPFKDSPIIYFVHNIVMMFIAVSILFKFLNLINKNNYIINTSCVLLMCFSHAFIYVQMQTIVTERLIVALLSMFMFFSWKGKEKQSTIYYCLAFLCAVYATYCKEPEFIIFFVFSATNLFFDQKASAKDRFFYISLIINSAIYVCVYLCVLFVQKNNHFYMFSSVERDPFQYILTNSSFCLLFSISTFTIARFHSLLAKKNTLHIFSDGLLFASFSHIIAYLILRRFGSSYLYLPSIVLALPSIAHVLVSLFKRYQKTYVRVMILLIQLIAFSNPFDCYSTVDSIIKARKTSDNQLSLVMKNYDKTKRVVWYRDEKLGSKYVDYHVFCDISFNLINIFLKYLLDQKHIQINEFINIPHGYFYNGTKDTLVHLITNLNDISKDDLIFIAYTTNYLRNEFVKKMEENDFSSTVSFYFNAIQILCRKKLSEISLPHKFLFHSADDQNIVLCGFLHLDNEIKCINHSKFVFSSPFEGRIKFKVKAQDLKITLSYTTTTDNEELRDEPLRIFINDREIAKLDMEKQELRKISFNIPKEDIKNNTVVLVFKLNSGKPITLRGGDFYEAAFGIKEIEVESAHYHFTNL